MHQTFLSKIKSKFIITAMGLFLRSELPDKFIKRVLVSSILFSTSLIPVNADNDDEYLSLNDYDSINAYGYWSHYGLVSDTSNIYSNESTTTGTINTTASISISGTDSIGGTINMDDIDWYESVIDQKGWKITSGGLNHLLSGLDINVEASGTTYDTINVQPQACTVTGTTIVNGVARNYSVSCSAYSMTDNNTTEYSVDVTANDTGKIMYIEPAITTYTHPESGFGTGYQLSNGSMNGLASVSLIETVNESGTISSTGSVALTTTTTNINSFKYVYPLVKGTIDNTKTAYKKINIGGSFDKFTFVVLKDTNTNTLYTKFKLYDYSTDEEIPFTVNNRRNVFGGMNLEAFTINVNSSSVYNAYLQWTNDGVFGSGFIPLYVGYPNNMSDSLYRFVYGSDRTQELINQTNNLITDGTTESQTAVDNMDTVTDSFTTTNDNYHNAEVAQLDSMDQALENIDTTDNLVENFDFLSTAQWVTLQFNRLVNNTPLELVITFSLILGLALVFIGKVR